jgi:hypothetical protein
VSTGRFAVACALLTLLPAPADGKAISSADELEPADFWVWIEGANGALDRIEARDSSPVSLTLENPTIGGQALDGQLTARNERLPTGPATSVTGSLNGSLGAPLSTQLSLASFVTFDVAALSATTSSASVRMLGSGIGGSGGHIAFSSGFVTMYSTNAGGQIDGVVDAWEIPDDFSSTPIDDVVVLATNELYRIIIRSTAEIIFGNTTNVEHFAYLFVDPTLGTSTPDVELVVSENLPEALPEAGGRIASLLSALDPRGARSPERHAPLAASAAAVVLERIVALADGLAEADVLRAADEVEALLGVARDAIEQRAERAARLQAHVLGGLVAQQLHHHELADR